MRSITAFVTVLAAALVLPLPTAAQPPGTDVLTFDDLFDEERTGRRPEATAWSPDGEALTYLWDAGDGRALWAMDAASGETTRLLAASAFGEDASIDAYTWAPAGDALALESGGDLWLLEPGPSGGEGNGALTRLTETEADEEDPAFSPDGRKLAYVREADLYLLDLTAAPDERVERALTTDGVPGRSLNATTSWVYWEEIWGRDPEAFWWSPDSTRIAYYRFDESPVGEYPILEDYRPVYPDPRRQRYPKAGSDNPEARVGVLDLGTGETTWLETGAEEETYPARVHWVDPDGDGGTVAVERLNRDQTRLDLLFCDPADGACRPVLSDGHPTWVNLGRETRFLPGGLVLWASERDGWRHLYLYETPAPDAGGDGPQGLVLVGRLTSGPWAVTSVDHAGAEAVIATAHGTGPLGAARRRLLRIPLGATGQEDAHDDPAEPAVLAAGPGWHTAEASPDGRRLLHRWSSADAPGWERIETVTAAGGLEAGPELPAEAPAYEPAALPAWRLFEMPVPEGDRGPLPAALLLPAGVDEDAGAGEARKRPVVMYHYGGPGSQVVVDRWSTRGRALWHKMMAQRGYGVLMVDNPASVFFGKAGEDLQHRRFGEVNRAAQEAGAAYLESLPWVDADRIGLWGWSGGGSNTLYCLLRSPGTWRAGVAGAPVTDWRYYDTIWTERYLDHPEDNPEGYRDSSPATYAESLEDRLLIVHGTADDNVHPQNTLALTHAWVEAGIPFEMAIYPGEKHGFQDTASRHFYERMTEFFDRALE